MFYSKTVLDNGISVVTEHMDGVRSASLGLWVRTGARDESLEMGGISHFMEHMLFKGTPTRSAMEISAAFDGLGAELNAFTSREATCFYSRMMDKNLPQCFEILADMLVNASFSEDTVIPERQVVIEEIARSEDTPDDYVFDLFAQAMYPDHALGRPVLGTRDIVGNFNGDDLHAYHDAHYTTGNIFVVVCGNVDHQQVVDLAKNYLADAIPGEIRKRPAFEANDPKPLTVLQKESEQAHIIMGWRSIDESSPKRYAYQILSSALGGSMSSRLFTEIREKRGLVYSVYSMGSLYEGAGSFSVYAGTRPENISEVIDVAKAEFKKFADKGIEKEELERVRQMVCGNYVLSMESPRTHMVRLGKMISSNREIISLDETLEAYRSVTREEVNDAARELLGRDFITAVISPYSYDEILEMI